LFSFVDVDEDAGECKSLQQHGVNIEGVAVSNGFIHVGLRAPSLDGASFIIRVAENSVFGATPAASKVFRPRLGIGMGIRDLAKVRGGFLVLAGAELPEEDGAVGKAELFFWRGDSTEVIPLEALGDMMADVKPEALLVLEEQDTAYRVLIAQPPSWNTSDNLLRNRICRRVWCHAGPGKLSTRQPEDEQNIHRSKWMVGITNNHGCDVGYAGTDPGPPGRGHIAASSRLFD
jgi:Protein of unknown function (DUF3616)